jgi:hypothetical protein
LWLLVVEPGLGELGGAESALGRVWPVQVVVDAPVFEKDPGLEERVEELPVEELVAEPAVERFDPGVLPWRAGVDEHGVGAVEPAPVGDCVGDELGPVMKRT